VLGGLPTFDLLVRGRIEAIPKPGIVRVSVSRYYKGTGLILLVAQVSGSGQGQPEGQLHSPESSDGPLPTPDSRHDYGFAGAWNTTGRPVAARRARA